MQDGRRIAILGATGSIGAATLDVVAQLARHSPAADWRVCAMSGHSRIDELVAAAHSCQPPPETIVVSDPAAGERARDAIKKRDLQQTCRLDLGEDALVRAATDEAVDTVVAGIVGRAGLESTLAAVQAGKRVGLANKETLVIAGPVVTAAAARSGAELLPIDSEHSAIYQCLAEARCLHARSAPATATAGQGPGEGQGPGQGPESGQGPEQGDGQDAVDSGASRQDNDDAPGHLPGVRRLILTASGGPFRDWSTEAMQNATPAAALNHPTWDMGQKITIDSATMMNKSLEVIEAKWLFDVPADRIEVMIHPQSIIHSLVEFEDGSVIAQLSPPDMRLPIQYALTYPHRLPCPAPPLDRGRSWEMSLMPADPERFPALELGFEVARAGGTAGVVLNGANEVAVPLFLNGKIRFTDIARLCKQTLDDHHHESSPTLQRLLELDEWSRRRAEKIAETIQLA
ncbi:1-deoxy-D-xylulose-5-phosphate reductoisomerase [Allorhodopirellula solitaria]|uniref:1-deoxy-D-xylulose 5-phosphate reductoisomerase n=1 Tax=Allorhodopirellula solitaria TaxID=2527987 RepID=A0A5C5YKM8_9BACT|nr:1-deoxy-D-xylulose-5-phosphate reductoisomerase [Allorhodopirellula solitaria]TWT75426.1 1-deoxy-D-xylulose 5-phosphate reductoisomerase [Allorhodopirellula solitaria]